MKFGLVHRIMTHALALLGALALLSGGGVRPWVCALVLAQVLRVATRRAPAHDVHILVLALAHFVLGSLLGGGAAYLACVAGALVVTPGALVLSHLRREVEGNYTQGARDRTGLPVDVPRILRSRRVIGRVFLASTFVWAAPFFVVLFVALPRVSLSLLPEVPMEFASRVDLGAPGEVATDPALVMRITGDPGRTPLYLRGRTFDAYDGRAWRAEAAPFLVRRPDPKDRKITIDREPLAPSAIFVPEGAAAIVERGSARYDAYLGEAVAEPIDRGRYLALPADLPARVRTLAHAWADAESTPAGKARAIAGHLAHDFSYDVRSPSWGKEQPIDDFLFVSRRGHCEFFATALVILLREVGVPSRVATGFLGGAYNHFGDFYAVRRSDAHAWALAYVDGRWEVFDGTPRAAPESSFAREFFEGYGAASQRRLLGPAWRALVIAAIGAVLLRAWAWWRRRPSAARSGEALRSASPLCLAIDQALARVGVARDPSTTPARHAEELARRGHPLAGEIGALTRVYLEVRFGGRVLASFERREFARRLAKLGAP
jgi:transglutaminase-like putative cysteine protease